jgi:hypothetical protein
VFVCVPVCMLLGCVSDGRVRRCVSLRRAREAEIATAPVARERGVRGEW